LTKKLTDTKEDKMSKSKGKNKEYKKKWNTQDMLDALQKGLPNCTFEVGDPWGDIDAEHIFIESSDAQVVLFGFDFNSNNFGRDPSDCEVDMISVVLDPENGIVGVPSVEEITLLHRATNILKAEGHNISHDGWGGYF
jgi:hypothetical protein